VNTRPAIGAVHTGCACCPPKPDVAPMDWRPHPGFGWLELTRDGEVPEWWREFCAWPTVDHYIEPEWVAGTVKVGPRKGEPWGFWTDTDIHWTLSEVVTLAEIETCAALDPDHDWLLEIHGPLGGVVYQRQGCSQWVAVERLEGFA
jgi:hypothetical protein